jgi:hypothetical protein
MKNRITATPMMAEIPILLHIKLTINAVCTGPMKRKGRNKKLLSKRATSFARRFTA